MWGNSLGWGISVVIALAAAGLVALLGQGSNTTPGTAFSNDVVNFQPLRPPTLSGAAAMPNETCDAGLLYRQAIDAYLANRALYDDFAGIGKLDSPKVKQLTAIDFLIDASKCGNMSLFTSRPQELVTYAHDKSSLDALEMLGRVCIDRLALLNQRAERPAAAMQFCGAAMALGNHLVAERLSYAELDLGLRLLAKSTPMMIKLAEQAGESDRATALKEFDAARLAMFREQVEPVAAFVRSIDPRVVGSRSGDVFALAERSKERMWRVEAVLALGRVRFFAGAGGTAANQRAAMQRVRKMAEDDPDPIVRIAAAAARDLTVEQYRSQ
jgi:hypothetical protein